ncbi:MAG: FHA domain-containing protein [Polyangia bacterium]
MLILTLAEKGGESKDLTFDKTEIRVGRVRDNDIVLPKGNVSKHHCRLLLQNGQLTVEDLGSTNGTYVNGRKIAETTSISTSDKVFVGDFAIRVTGGVRTNEPQIGSGPPAYTASAPEAGSLSTALPRRAPPPPPPPRPGSLYGGDEGSGPFAAHGSQSHVPAPPPPPKRESRPMAAVGDPLPPPPLPTEINLDDDDALSSPAPRLNVPPLRPPVRVPTPTPSPSPEEPLTTPRGAAPDQPAHEPERPSLAPPPPLPPPPVPPAPPPPAHAAPAPMAASTQPGADYPPWLLRLLDSEGTAAAFFSGTQSVEVERNGRREAGVVASADLASLPDHLRRLAAKGVPRPEPDAPVIDTTLADGTRITALFPPLCDRLRASIRRPNVGHKTLEELVTDGGLSAEMQQVLEACVSTRQNLLIAGDRTSCDLLLGTLAWSLDRVARVVVLAESIAPPASAVSWLKLPVAARTPDLVAAAVSMRPDYVVADAAASILLGDLLRECACGQNGALTAMVARSSNDALYRLRVMGAAYGSSSTPNDLLGSSLDVLVHAITLTDGSLRVMEIAEPNLGSAGELRAETLLSWQSKGKGKGRFIATRTPSRLAGKLEAGGVSIADNVLQR